MNSTDWANVFWNTRFTKNFDPFQMIIVPPEFPIDGGIGEVVKCLGTNFLYVLEVQRLLVSCKQIISHPISWYLFLLELHFFRVNSSNILAEGYSFSCFRSSLCIHYNE
jgi:hypothetical protein